MRVETLKDHINDYALNGPAAAVGGERLKTKGDQYEIADKAEAKRLIEDGLVKEIKGK